MALRQTRSLLAEQQGMDIQTTIQPDLPIITMAF
jgi:hypothetical protein